LNLETAVLRQLVLPRMTFHHVWGGMWNAPLNNILRQPGQMSDCRVFLVLLQFKNPARTRKEKQTRKDANNPGLWYILP